MNDGIAGTSGLASERPRRILRAARTTAAETASEGANSGIRSSVAPINVDDWIEMHRRRMELIAAYREAARLKSEREKLRLRQEANRLFIEICRIERDSNPRWRVGSG